MPDFFTSYTAPNKDWAEWIGYVLEEENFKVVLQAWDFRPGSNFVLEMQKAAETADRTIMVLSPDYLKSHNAAPEWAAAFVNDPEGKGRKLIPVMVEPCSPTGMLKSLVHINLTGQTEAAAREMLLSGLQATRAKPASRPAFPGQAHPHKDFPGQSDQSVSRTPPKPYIPNVSRPTSDIEKRRYLKQAFDSIAGYFEAALPALTAARGDIEVDFQRESASEFAAEIFVGGKSISFCRIWRGDGMSGDGICFSEGRNSLGHNSYNEILSTNDDSSGDLRLASLMGGVGLGRVTAGFDMKRLTQEQAAEYLWRRLVSRLER